MKNSNTISWILLIVLTFVSVIFADRHFAIYSILLLSLSKIVLVAYQFMDLKDAHKFWITAVVFLISAVLLVTVIQIY